MRSVGLIPIPPADVPNMIGKPVHVSWAPNGCVWILEKVQGEKALLVTPRTRKSTITTIDTLRYTRRHEYRGSKHEKGRRV